MGIIKTQAIHNTIISYSGAVIGYINVLILLPYAFSPEQIGLVKILQNAAALFVPVAQLGITSVIIRYFPFFKVDERQKRGFFLYTVLISFSGFALFSVFFILFKNQIVNFYITESPLFIDYYQIIIPLTFFLLFFGIFEAFSNSNYKTAIPVFLRDIGLRLITAILALLFVTNIIGFNEFVWLLVGGYGLVLLFLMIYLGKIGELKTSWSFTLFDKKLLREIFSYGLFVLLGSTGALLIANIDVLMIGSMLGLRDAGIYAIAFAISAIIDIPRRAIKQIIDPFVALAIKNEDELKIKELYDKVSINQLLIGILFVLGIWSNINEIFALMPNGKTYEVGKYVILILLISKLLDMSTSINGEIIGYSKYYKFNILSILILAILTVVTNLVFIPLYGISGAALATLLSLLFFNITKFIFIKIKFGIQPFNANTMKIVVLGGVCYLITLVLPLSDKAMLNIVINSISILLVYSFGIYVLKISEEVNNLISKLTDLLFRR